MFSLKLISEMKVTCMPIVCFIFSPFVLHVYSFRSSQVAYACTFPSEQGSETTYYGLKNGYILLLLKLNFERKGGLYANCLFYILDICCKRRLFHFLPCGIRMHIHLLTGVEKGHTNS